jgi:hypothetical protein
LPARRPHSSIIQQPPAKTKKFYHQNSAPPPEIAIWQRIQPAVRIRSRLPRTPIVPESANLPFTLLRFSTALLQGRSKSDSGTSTGHQLVRWLIARLHFPMDGKAGRSTFAPAGI